MAAAQAAQNRGQLKTRNNQLSAFQNEVHAQSGKSFTEEDAARLEILAEILKGGE